MKKSVKVIISLVLTLALCVGTVCVFAEENKSEAETRLYNYYKDEMLLAQNKDAIFSGIGVAGDTIKCVLLNSENTPVKQAQTTVAEDGTFILSFVAPAGGYEEYTVKFYKNGIEFESLENVVFGELWLAAGQSNMQFNYGGSITGSENIKKGIKGSKWVRFLDVPGGVEYNGDMRCCPLLPQKEIPKCRWYRACDDEVYDISAVGYFFAEKLQQDLDMPVGVMCANLGGSFLISWLSRETIESDESFVKDLKRYDSYIPASKWDESAGGQNNSDDMTVNYNKKIDALKNFRPTGMIWYQGEAEVRTWKHGSYSKAFDLLQKSYTELFQHTDGPLPIVFTQFASYRYDENAGTRLPDRLVELSEIQQAHAETMALTSIYDVPLTYDRLANPGHPLDKAPVGYKMADSAEGLVYKMSDCYTTATVKNTEIKDGAVYVTFRDVGDGLVLNEGCAKTFTVCGKDGIYVPADAEIISKDTVKISSELVPEPVSATYAFSQYHGRANLYATKNGHKYLGVSPFVTDLKAGKEYYVDNGWTDCDSEKIWRNGSDTLTGFHDTWESETAQITFSKEDAYKGDNGLNVKGSGKFSINPGYKFNDEGKQTIYMDLDRNLTKYGKLSFKVRNNGAKDVTLDSAKVLTGIPINLIMTVDGTDGATAVIPSDGQWHEIVLDMNRMYFGLKTNTVTFSRMILFYISGFEFTFSADGEADISVDDFRFVPDTAPTSFMTLNTGITAIDSSFNLCASALTGVVKAIVDIVLWIIDKVQ